MKCKWDYKIVLNVILSVSFHMPSAFGQFSKKEHCSYRVAAVSCREVTLNRITMERLLRPVSFLGYLACSTYKQAYCGSEFVPPEAISISKGAAIAF